MADDVILDIRNLVIEARSNQGATTLVDGVNLTLRRGEVLGLIGESGAGKSTLGLAAMGYTRDGCRISKGEILFKGRDLASLSENERRKVRGVEVAYVAQSASASFNPAFRLANQVIEAPVVHGIQTPGAARHKSIELFSEIQLPNPAHIGLRFPHQVSGGQLQRCMTAMAMMCNPDLIIFDEPTTALDVTTQIEVLAAIRRIVKDHGTAAIYITHDLAVVAQMADRIKVLRYGKEVEEAETTSMLTNPSADYTKALWAVRKFHKTPVPEKQTSPLLQVSGLCAGYRRVQVLSDVDLSIQEGRTIAVVGESGSGKSTLARVLSGLLPPTQGSIHYDGRPLEFDVSRRSKQLRQEIQMIYQSSDTALNARQRVREIIGRPLEFFVGLTGREKEERIRSLLDMIDLDPDVFIDRFPDELSGGQKQRVCIARAIAADPKLLICDEITSALDQIVAEEMLKLLDRLQRELGLSYLFITHDISTVRAIADEVVVMQHGRVVETGPKNRVFDSPEQDYTVRLLNSVPEMDPEWLDRKLAKRAAFAG